MIAIKVPPLGESIVEATISRWVKREGETVAAGDTLVELETDKITVEVPAPSAGVVAKLLKAEGDVVAVDKTLGQIDETATAGAGTAGAGTAAAAPAAAPPTAGTAAAGTAAAGTAAAGTAGSGYGGTATATEPPPQRPS